MDKKNHLINGTVYLMNEVIGNVLNHIILSNHLLIIYPNEV